MQKFVESNYDKRVSLLEVRRVLKKTLKYKYKVVKRVPFQGNTLRNLVLRQKWGKFMIDLLSSDKKVLVIDQSWLSTLQFYRMRWHKR